MNKKKRRGISRKCWRGVWNKKGKREIKVNRLETEERKLDEDWELVEKRIKGMIERIEKSGAKKRRRRGWWDENCEAKKREVRRKLKDWRIKGGREERYKRGKQEFKKLCERRKKEENSRWERKTKKVRKEGEVWDLMNGERRRRKKR